MKQTIKFIAKMIVAAIVAMIVALGVEAMGFGYRFGFVSVFMCVAIGVAALLGAFNVTDKAHYDSIRHYDGRRSYNQAAIFVGTACLFIGSPKECEQVLDDLWHRGVQAEVTELTENDVDFNIL